MGNDRRVTELAPVVAAPHPTHTRGQGPGVSPSSPDEVAQFYVEQSWGETSILQAGQS